MKSVDWYFDFISPYAYLASQQLSRIEGADQIVAKPVLFAGLLKHWDTKGPAEIDSMRRFTYRQIAWLAQQHHIPLRFPPMHPFNPLRLLRLYIALGGGITLAQLLFRFIWAEGGSSNIEADWHRLLNKLGLDHGQVEVMLRDETVKQTLSENTEQALRKGVFGVPAFVVDQQIFWGFDSIDFLNAYLLDPTLLESDCYRQADNVGAGVQRKS